MRMTKAMIMRTIMKRTKMAVVPRMRIQETTVTKRAGMLTVMVETTTTVIMTMIP
jgi:hypothetical protein